MPVRGRGRGRRSQEASQLEQSLDSASLSTASLPSRYAVTVAKAGAEPTAAEYNEAYVRGAELISDIDKVTPGCGVSLVPLPPRQGLWHDNSSNSRHRVDGERKVLWRTAGLVYPCTCNLMQWQNVYRFAGEPPLTASLARLETHPEPHQMPMLGDDMWSWSTVEDNEVDLDSAMSELADFAPSWQQATVSRPVASGLQSKGKGKARAEARDPSFRHPPARSLGQQRILEPPAPTSSFAMPDATPPESPDYIEDARERRAWWRDQIDSDEGYHKFRTVVARDTYPALPGLRKRRYDNSDAFKTPRNFNALPHPFHPDIMSYCLNAGTRVFWMIPIHGPVIIPRLNDPITQPDARPWPSRAEFSVGGDAPHPTKDEKRPAVIRWSADDLRAFVHDYFEPVYKDPQRLYGPLHLAFSGPKPDPYLALEPPPPLESHLHLPKRPHATGREPPPPVRPEAGDHLRIYCDASRAMSLRTWLHWWTIGADNALRRPFERARFTLVGPRGEALVVA